MTAKPGEAAAARWANSSTASPRPPRPAPPRLVPSRLGSGSGTGSGSTGQQCSPGTFIGQLPLAADETSDLGGQLTRIASD